MPGRTALALASALLACSSLGVLTDIAVAVVGEAPTVATPSISATSAASVQVTVSVDTHGTETTVMVEYVTAGAYRAGTALVPGAATTVTIGVLPASDAGPALLTGQVGGLDPDATYRMRVKAVNVGGETSSVDVTVKTPRAPKMSFKAKVGAETTRLTKLTVTGLSGGESAKVRCKTSAKGCPFTKQTVAGLATGRHSLSSLLKRSALEPGAKVTVQVSAGGARLSTLVLTVRDGQQPKVKRK